MGCQEKNRKDKFCAEVRGQANGDRTEAGPQDTGRASKNNAQEQRGAIEYALVSDDTRQWASLDYDQSQQVFPDRFHVVKLFKTGRIPWRNIRHYDLRGDEYYRCPHLYCLYANDGMPYEGFWYYIINEPDAYEFELPIQDRIDLASLLGKLAAKP